MPGRGVTVSEGRLQLEAGFALGRPSKWQILNYPAHRLSSLTVNVGHGSCSSPGSGPTQQPPGAAPRLGTVPHAHRAGAAPTRMPSAMKPVSRPIFIVGTGRCGSTAFQRVLSMHREVMWLSGVAYLFPRRPVWNRRAVTAMGNPLLHRILGGVIRPGEQYRFWEEHAHGFSEPCRDLVASDVTPRVKKQVRAAIAPMLTGKRSRLLAKITGWPRMGFLNEIFEDARFVHIIRDGRAVASSLLHVDFWDGWRGPGGWRVGPLSAEDQAAWEASSRSFVTLAGLEWRIQMRAMDAARRALSPDQFLEVKYEEFCEQPLETCRRVLDF